MTDRAARLEALRPEQRNELLRRLRRAAPDPSIPRRPADSRAPLSSSQLRLWLLNRFDPENPAYNMAAGARITGACDRGALRRALDLLVARHESLRALLVGDEEPRAEILPEVRTALPMADLSGCGAANPEAAALAAAQEWLELPFDLAASPPFRAMLMRLRPELHILLLTVHHTAADLQSLDILLRELVSIYGALIRGAAPALPALEIQFPDFAAWEQRRIAAGAFRPDIEYWKKQLDGVQPLQWPWERAAIDAFRGGRVARAIPAELNELVSAFALRQGATRFMVLLAVFQMLLSRWSGATGVTVGVPVANRSRSELAGVVGLLSNTMVLRAGFSAEMTFRAFVDQVRRAATEGYAHLEAPFELVVQAANPRRSAGANPLFQAMFAIYAAEPPRYVEALKFEPLEVCTETAKADVFLMVLESERETQLCIEYSRSCFTCSRAGELLAEYEATLAAALANADATIGALTAEPAAATAIADCWQMVLSARPRSRNANFFESGGDAVAAVRLESLLAAEFELSVPRGFVACFATLDEMHRRIEAMLTAEIGALSDEEVLKRAAALDQP